MSNIDISSKVTFFFSNHRKMYFSLKMYFFWKKLNISGQIILFWNHSVFANIAVNIHISRRRTFFSLLKIVFCSYLLIHHNIEKNDVILAFWKSRFLSKFLTFHGLKVRNIRVKENKLSNGFHLQFYKCPLKISYAPRWETLV